MQFPSTAKNESVLKTI